VEVINQGIREHTWTGSNLRNFESALAGIDLIPALALALRFERASFNISIDSLLRSGNNEVFNESFGSGKASSPATRYPFYWFWVYRKFVFPDDKAYYNQAIQTWVEALDQASQVGVSSRQLPKFSAAAKASVFENKKRLFSALIFPGLDRLCSGALSAGGRRLSRILGCPGAAVF
jgi:hypothetical protein